MMGYSSRASRARGDINQHGAKVIILPERSEKTVSNYILLLRFFPPGRKEDLNKIWVVHQPLQAPLSGTRE